MPLRDGDRLLADGHCRLGRTTPIGLLFVVCLYMLKALIVGCKPGLVGFGVSDNIEFLKKIPWLMRPCDGTKSYRRRKGICCMTMNPLAKQLEGITVTERKLCRQHTKRII